MTDRDTEGQIGSAAHAYALGRAAAAAAPLTDASVWRDAAAILTSVRA